MGADAHSGSHHHSAPHEEEDHPETTLADTLGQRGAETEHTGYLTGAAAEAV